MANMQKRSTLVAILISVVLTSMSNAATIYVGYASDPYEAIQDAINAANNGDMIIVRPGTYREALTINKALSIKSQNGSGQTTVESPSAGSDRVFDVSASNVTIHGFTVKNGERGVNLNYVSSCIITNNYFTGNKCGIQSNVSTATITSNQLSANTAGIYFDESGGTISNNTISGHADYGIGISYAQNLLIEANTFSSNEYGIWLKNAGNNTVTGNNLHNNGIAINLWNSTNITLTSNTVTSNRDCGINIYQSSHNQINNNTVTQHLNLNYAGIFLHDQSYQNTVVGNTVSNNNLGIVVSSSNNTINDNQLDQNYWYAIEITSDNNTIYGNTLSNGFVTGLRLHHAIDNMISGNTAYGNDDGIHLDSSSAYNIITGNMLRTNSNSGVMLTGSSQNTITGNTIESNVNFGINLDQAHNNSIFSNTVQSNGLCGIQVYISGGNTIYNNRILNNSQNGCDTNSNNHWNIPLQAGVNIIGGPYLGGNSWSDYPGRDLDGDGLGDTFLPHTSSGSIGYGGDEYPLVSVGTNSPPATPSFPVPVGGAIYQSVNAALSWQGGDPDLNDTVRYDVYLDTAFPLLLVSANQQDNTYDPAGLLDRTTYYWRVIAKDDLSLITQGPEWNFTIDSSVVISYLLEEDSDTVLDVSGNGNDGTVTGASFSPGQGLLGGNTFRFDWSASDRIRVPYQSSQSATQSLTLEAWIYPTAWDNIAFGYNRIISKQPIYLLRARANGHAHFQINTENYGYQGVYDSQVMSLNEWHYVVGTFDGQNIKLYVDGQLRDTHALPSVDNMADNAADIYIGEYPNLAEGFSGLIDSVAILKRDKSHTEVAATYAAITNPCEGDLNVDKHVDGMDLSILAAEFARTDCNRGFDCLSDITDDGTIDELDLARFAADYGRSDCP